MKARIIVTKKCNRHCIGCCNEQYAFNEIDVLEDKNALLPYKEIMITGGEPMLVPFRVIRFLEVLRDYQKYTGKIYIYTALYHEGLTEVYSRLSKYVNGINFTLHDNSTDQDIRNLKLLSDIIHKFTSVSLRIDSRLYERYDFSNIDFTPWEVIRKMKWQESCSLPENERLFIYEL